MKHKNAKICDIIGEWLKKGNIFHGSGRCSIPYFKSYFSQKPENLIKISEIQRGLL